MSTPAINQQPTTLKGFLAQPEIEKKFKTLLGERSGTFLASVVQIANSNDMLKSADPISIMNAALTAATLGLVLNNNLGFAYIVPYKSKTGVQAQFQIGCKGFVQLAQRSGQFKTIAVSPIYEGQILHENPLTGYEFDFTIKGERIVGYAAYFKLNNGFEATHYMTVEQIKAHAGRFSQTYKQGYGVWKDNFDAMAQKTVLKLLLAKFAPLSVDMQKAVVADQGIIKDEEATEIEYIDNQEEPVTITDVEDLFKKVKDRLDPEDFGDVKRIIDNNEEASFKKAIAVLEKYK